VLRGTGRGAMELERNDLAGKTGTTNEHRDAWFSGFNDALVATTWIGFDDFTSLGRGEFASKAAIPIWVSFMRVALEGVPEREPELPPGITTARISAGGQLLDGGEGIVEMFKVEDIARMAAMRQAQEQEQQDAQQPYEIF
jgi:penicillin-binding protein 1A